MEEWSNWQKEQQGGWANRGLKLIDYGRSIDITLYKPGTLFSGDCHTDSFRCIEMQKKLPWTFQPDIFGIASVVHCLLFGEYMEVIHDSKTNRYKAKEPFKRYWQTDLWSHFFDVCLNIKDCNSIPNLNELKKPFEQFILNDNNRPKAIKTLLCRQNIMMFEFDNK